MAPPLMSVVPPVLVVTEAAVSAALIVPVPVVLIIKAPSAPLVAPPTTPVKVTLPEPVETVSALAAEAVLPTFAALLTVEENKTVLLVVVKVIGVPVNTTAPV
ncbi:hypothetical protein POBR111598_09975 [Polynucleobacter brandtiae]